MFTIEFETDNDAFVDDPAEEVVRILRRISVKVREGGRTEGSVLDSNGNTVGRWTFTPPTTCEFCGNLIDLRLDPSGQRGPAWAESSWGDDRDFQCGLNPDGAHTPK